MKEIFKKFENHLPTPLIDDMSQVCKIDYNLMHFQKFANTKKNSVKMGLENNLLCTSILEFTSNRD